MTFVLPTVQRLPVGGYKVTYEYANQLSRRGFEVTIVHPAGALSNNLPFWRSQLRHMAGRDRTAAGLVPWFDFDPAVKIRLLPYLHERWLPAADVTMFTAWSTTRALSDHLIGRVERLGLVAQLVMDYELWLTSPPATRRRMELELARPGVRRIVISDAVRTMLVTAGSVADSEVTLGVELERFRVISDPVDRAPVVGFPLRGEPHKGALDAFEAQRIVSEVRPDARWVCFGGGRAPAIPAGVEARGTVTPEGLVELYNECAVFVLPSWAEGWGLPAAEAMACGAAVVSTANGGTESFLIDGVNALIVPPHDPQSLAGAVLRLLGDHRERTRLSSAGHKVAATMSWDRSTDQLCTALGLPVGP
jgi:glycosyltransferase involved in cell wall biosynthesis